MVPEEMSAWNPDTAPQAMVMKQNGNTGPANTGPEPSMKRVTAGIFTTDDADAAAWRLLSVLDGLALQVVAHAVLITREDVVAWSRSAAERELGLRARSR